jgi:hypothetical protein
LPWAVRTFFNRTSKAFEHLHFEKELHIQRINAQAYNLEGLKMRKKRKVPVNANELFAGIEKIKAARVEQRRKIGLSQDKDLAAEARRTANKAVNISIEQMSFQFSIFG